MGFASWVAGFARHDLTHLGAGGSWMGFLSPAERMIEILIVLAITRRPVYI